VPITNEIQETSGVVHLVDGPPDRRRAQLDARNDAAKQAVGKDRRCPLWMEYQPGLGPREHLAGKARRDMEEDRRRFLESLEQQRQGFERELAASRDIFTINLSEANKRDQERTSAITNALTWAAVFLAGAQILAAIAALTCESLLWTWLGITALGCP
jgi:hypothetical protein